MQRKSKIFFLCIFLLPLLVQAKKFETNFIEFEIPKSWECSKVQSAWVCKSTKKHEKAEAFFVLAAKAVGPEDTRKNLIRQLSSPKSIKDKENTPVFSIVLSKGIKPINKTSWYNSTHMNSELMNYKSIYYSTLTQSLSILFSMHVNSNYLIKYKKDFLTAENSIKLKYFKLNKNLTRATENSPGTKPEPFEQIHIERKKKKLPIVPIAGGVMALLAIVILYKSFT